MNEATSLKALVKARGLKLIDLSRGLGVDKSTVTRWARKRVPAERVVDLERVTGIPRHALRPDLYPEETAA